MANNAPKWSDLRSLTQNLLEINDGINKRREIFVKINESDTACEADKNTAKAVIEQIDAITTSNEETHKELMKLITDKTKLKPRAGVKVKDQEIYLKAFTTIDERLNETGCFDELLIKKLHKSVERGIKDGE